MLWKNTLVRSTVIPFFKNNSKDASPLGLSLQHQDEHHPSASPIHITCSTFAISLIASSSLPLKTASSTCWKWFLLHRLPTPETLKRWTPDSLSNFTWRSTMAKYKCQILPHQPQRVTKGFAVLEKKSWKTYVVTNSQVSWTPVGDFKGYFSCTII